MNYYDLIYSPNLNFLTKDNFIDIRSSMLHNGDGLLCITVFVYRMQQLKKSVYLASFVTVITTIFRRTLTGVITYSNTKGDQD